MKLRNHPALNYNGIRSWPPLWSRTQITPDKSPRRGEIGVLKYAEATREMKQCYLVIEYENAEYGGYVFCDDAKFCAKLAMVLAHQQHRSIAEIGDLEF